MAKRRISKLLILIMLAMQLFSGISFGAESVVAETGAQLTEQTGGTESNIPAQGNDKSGPGTEPGPTTGSAGDLNGEPKEPEIKNGAPTTSSATDLNEDGAVSEAGQSSATTGSLVENSIQVQEQPPVKLAELIDGKADISEAVTEEELRAAGTDKISEFFLVRFEDGTREIRRVEKKEVSAFEATGQQAANVNELIQAYEKKPEVAYSEPVFLYKADDVGVAYVPNDPYYADGNPGMWGVKATHTDQVYGRITEDKLQTVVVAVIDTGVNYNHTDLDDTMYRENGIVKGYDFVNKDADAIDDHGHGTHVAGTIAAEGNNGEGIVGIAEGVRIMPVKVLAADGYGNSVTIGDAIKWAADNGANVINMSLGGGSYSEELKKAIDYAWGKGVTIVAATGNNARNDIGQKASVNYPAAYGPVIAVGAVQKNPDNTLGITYFSNSGPELDVVAPGMNILSTTIDGAYGTKSGTSMATPHTSALAALLKAQDSSRTPSQIEALMKASAQKDFSHDKIFGSDKDVYGAGAIDCFKALGLATGSGDMRLQGLSVTGLAGSFDPETKYYVANTSAASVTLKASGYNLNQSAWIKIGSGIYAPLVMGTETKIPVNAGLTIIKIRSFSEDNQSYTDYSVEVRNNGLTRLSILTPAFSTWLLSPVFQSDILEYSGVVKSNATSVELIASSAFSNASVTVNGTTYSAGSIMTLNLVAGLNKFVVAVKDIMGQVREYVINLTRMATYVNKVADVAGGTVLTTANAPVLTVYESQYMNDAVPKEFWLYLAYSEWPEGSDALLEAAVPDVNTAALKYNVAFSRKDSQTMVVAITGYQSAEKMPASLTIPLLAKVMSGTAMVTVDSRDTRILGGSFEFAKGQGIVARYNSPVKFDRQGYATLNSLTIEEVLPGSFLEERPLTLSVTEPGFFLAGKPEDIHVTGEGGLSNWSVGAIRTFAVDKASMTLLKPAANNRTVEKGKITLSGIRLKGVPGKDVMNIQLKISGRAVVNDTFVTVAIRDAVLGMDTTASTDGAIKLDASGTTALNPIHIVESAPYALLPGSIVKVELATEGYHFVGPNPSGAYSEGFDGFSSLGGISLNERFFDIRTPYGYPVDWVTPPSPTGDPNEFYNKDGKNGKITIRGLKIAANPGTVPGDVSLKISGPAMKPGDVKTLKVAFKEPVADGTGKGTSGGGGGGGGGGSGTFTISAANETEIQQNGLYLKFPAQSYRSDFSFKTAMFSFDKPPVSEGQTLISDIWNMGMTQTGDLQKPYFIRMGYSPSKVDKSKEKLALCWLDEQKNEWIPVEDVKVDYDFGNVTGSTQRQGKFALVATSLKGKTATLQPEAIPLSTPKTILKDIQGHWAEAAINKLVGKSAVSGNPDGTFQPEKQVTRGEFITMLVKALELKGTTDKSFSDLNGHWAAGAVKTAYGSGILTGYEDGTIRPDALITREQMASMITKAAKIPAGVPDKHPTDEALIAPWAKDAVLSAIKAGIISGYADNTFRPQALATKAEAVAIIARCMK